MDKYEVRKAIFADPRPVHDRHIPKHAFTYVCPGCDKEIRGNFKAHVRNCKGIKDDAYP